MKIRSHSILLSASVRFGLMSIIVFAFLQVSGCSSSEKDNREIREREKEDVSELSEAELIFEVAEIEQQNPMYNIDSDTTVLYWLNDNAADLSGYTKCNVFALNVLERAGFRTPDENCLSSDMFDTSVYNEVFPVVGMNEIEIALPGDLVVWNGHVIIFEKIVSAGGEDYALGWWAGTKQSDNGDNIFNNVCHGKYPLIGEFVIRRPVRIKE